jgi:hypothetical protein
VSFRIRRIATGKYCVGRGVRLPFDLGCEFGDKCGALLVLAVIELNNPEVY